MKKAPALFALLASLSLPLFAAKIPVTGRVLGPDGKPVPQARVSLLPLRSLVEAGKGELAGRIEAEAVVAVSPDASGAFRLEAPDAGMWRVKVEAPGFVPLAAAFVPLVEETDLPDAQLQPDAGLQVKVTDPQGKPAAGVRVRAEDSRRGGLLDIWRTPVRLAVTDANGTASLPRAKEESLRLLAAGPGSRVAERENVREAAVSLRLAAGRERRLQVRDAQGKPAAGALVTLQASRWPAGLTSETGTLDLAAPPADGIELSVAAADGRWLRFRLKPPRPEDKGAAIAVLPKAAPVTGRIVSAADGRPMAGALAWPALNAGDFVRAAADGTFRLVSVPEAETGVSTAAAGFFPEDAQAAGGRVPTLALQPRLAATGVVVDESGRPVAGAALNASYVPNPRAMSRMAVFRSGGFARSAANGRFRLAGLMEGFAYSLQVTRPGFAPTRLELPSREPGQAATDVRIVLRAGRAAFGAVLDGGRQPVAGARVSLRPAAPTEMSARLRASLHPEAFEGTADTDAAGRFEVKNVPAGTYDLVVRGAGFAPLTVPGLVLPEGTGRTDLGTVMLAPGAAVRGLVTDAKGTPLAGVEVRAKAAERGGFQIRSLRDPGPADAVTGADGSFVLADRSPGESLDLTASHPGFGSASAPGVAVPSETPVRMVLQPKVRVSGRTADPDGKPVPGASLFLSEKEPRNFGGQVMMMSSMHFQQGVSDDEGGFSFEAVSPGPIDIRASAPRWQEATIDGLEVKAGQDLAGVLLVLTPGASVEGRVVSPDGAPVPAAEVSVAAPSAGGRGGFSMLRATTDGDGGYRIEGIPPGPHTLEARAEGYRRAARDVEVTGEVRGVDLTLERGLEVSGRVVDDAGNPIPSVQIDLIAGRNYFDGQRGLTGPDGAFRLAGVQDGTYRLMLRKDGYAGNPEGETVTVSGAPVSGLEIRLSAGGAIAGRITGVEMSQLSRVRVWANSQMNNGRIDPEGNYRIPNLAPGSWQVEASVPDTTLHASGQVTLEPGAAEARLDLQLGGGHELRGTVLRNGQPLAGASLALTRKDTSMEQNAASDHLGSFRFGGLENGAYELIVSTPNGARRKEAVEISGDREVRVDLRTSALAGRVIDAADLSPVSGAAVALVPAEGDKSFLLPGMTTDGRGAFRVPEVGEGAWKLRASREGYVTAERPVQIGTDGSPDDVEIRLEPTQGVTVEAVLASGQSPDRIRVAVLGPDGRSVSTESYPTGENGRARVSSAPPGSWQLLVESDQSAPVLVSASVPGPVVRAVLPLAGQVRVVVPALASESTIARVTFTGPAGPFRGIDYDGSVASEWDLYAGKRLFTRLPAGTWQAVARTPDGRSWSGTANVTPGGVADVTLQ
ncbi:MAG: carboxypeptidase regulatory-like domain-containing protein [Thermoanaerobaculia bacterium]